MGRAASGGALGNSRIAAGRQRAAGGYAFTRRGHKRAAGARSWRPSCAHLREGLHSLLSTGPTGDGADSSTCDPPGPVKAQGGRIFFPGPPGRNGPRLVAAVDLWHIGSLEMARETLLLTVCVRRVTDGTCAWPGPRSAGYRTPRPCFRAAPHV